MKNMIRMIGKMAMFYIMFLVFWGFILWGAWQLVGDDVSSFLDGVGNRFDHLIGYQELAE